MSRSALEAWVWVGESLAPLLAIGPCPPGGKIRKDGKEGALLDLLLPQASPTATPGAALGVVGGAGQVYLNLTYLSLNLPAGETAAAGRSAVRVRHRESWRCKRAAGPQGWPLPELTHANRPVPFGLVPQCS